MDNFGKEVPSFNVGGETHINTIPGGMLNLLVLVVKESLLLLEGADNCDTAHRLMVL